MKTAIRFVMDSRIFVAALLNSHASLLLDIYTTS
jgi:hypothetical protein